MMEELKNSEFEIAEGEPDVTDWDVVDVHSAKIGDVDDVLFDPDARKVRYLIVNLEANELLLDNTRQVLIPIGLAVLDEAKDDVILPNITIKQLNALPGYEKDNVTPEFETAVRDVFEEGVVIHTTNEWKDFYEHDHFTESRFFNRNPDAERKDKVQQIINRINHKYDPDPSAEAEDQ